MEGEKLALALRAELVYRDPVFVPTVEAPADWTAWRCGGYWDDGTRISATFIRDSDQATERGARRAFRNGQMSEHVDGVNSLQRVQWTVNAPMIQVVQRFAREVSFPRLLSLEDERACRTLITQDVARASQLAEKTFHIPMNCCFRGRVYGIPHFNFQREDHVRSLFRFAQGMPIGDEGLH
jgi:DNA-directed RNA polymerase